ncbi:MAG: ABC transporter ATP-binding protein [Propionibacteriaceae bacterium]|nr:ABC transporter ATP-binding protein [Propionibacteriaceae bacterium]
MIQAEQLSVVRGDREVLAGAHLVAEPGEVVGVVGPNGSGKTTLLLALNRALRASGGTVVIDGDDLSRLPRREIARRVAVVAQDTDASLPLTVRDAVALGRLASRSLLAYGDASDRGLVRDALEQVQAVHLADRLVTQLSGGERQRVLVARAIAQRASHLLLDEPTNHLDLHHQFALLSLVTGLNCTVVMVLHDLNLAARYCQRLLLVHQGRIAATGTPEEVLTPEILEPIYRITVSSFEHEGRRQLVFAPEARKETS